MWEFTGIKIKMNDPSKLLGLERVRFQRNYTNAQDIFLAVSNEYPLHDITQPAKGWMQLFFMQVANGENPHMLWKTYNEAREAYKEIVVRNVRSAKEILTRAPDPAATSEVKDAFDRARSAANSTMGMVEQLTSVLGDPHSYEALIMAVNPSLRKLTPSKNWENRGQTIAFHSAVPHMQPTAA